MLIILESGNSNKAVPSTKYQPEVSRKGQDHGFFSHVVWGSNPSRYLPTYAAIGKSFLSAKDCSSGRRPQFGTRDHLSGIGGF